MKRILITGDLGFVGGHLWEEIREIKCRSYDSVPLIGLDLKRGANEDIRTAPLPDVDVVYHLAAQVDARTTDASGDADVNILGTIRLLERYGDKLVFASSCAVNYPDTPYAISKLACEHYCRMYGARIVRFCNLFGPGGHGVHAAFENQTTLQIRGDGEQRRTYAHVKRAVDLMLRGWGDLDILRGVDLTVNEVADLWFPYKEREHVDPALNEVFNGVQVYD